MDYLRIRQIKADFALLFVAFSWGLTFVVIQDALSDIGPYYFLTLRFSFALFFLALIYWRHFKYINTKTVKTGIFIGLILFGGYAFQTVGLKYTGPATAGFITGLAVVLVPIISALYLKKMPGPFVISGVACAALGLAFLTLKGGSYSLNYGDALIFLCAVCFASHIIAVGRYAGHYDPVLLAMLQIGVVALVSFIVALGTENMPSHFTRQVWIGFIVCSIPATSLAYLIQNSVQRYTSPTHTAIIFTMEPVFSAITAHLLAREFLNWQQAAGSMLILTGMLVAELKAAREETNTGQQA
ncbi:MAG: DMT family transporter [Firmicutes bacterium]|nr:DMT family transporter [Bacillota bacterium]